MTTVRLDFQTDDDNLNLTGSVTFRRNVVIERLRVVGLAEWRHVPANIIHVNENAIQALDLPTYSSALSKVGLNWIGMRAKNDILLSYAIRSFKREGLKKVQDQLTKFFKALGATSVKFAIANVNDVDIEE